jgi:two-component system sensor histidine kinase YesM
MASKKDIDNRSLSFQKKITLQMFGISSLVLFLITVLFFSTYFVVSSHNINSKIETTQNQFASDFSADEKVYLDFRSDISSDSDFLAIFDGQKNDGLAFSYLYKINNKIRLSFSMALYKGRSQLFLSSPEKTSVLEQSYLFNAEDKMDSDYSLKTYAESYVVERGNVTTIGTKVKDDSYVFLSFSNSELSAYFSASTSEGYVIFDRKRNVLSTNESRLIGNVNEYNFFGQSRFFLNGLRYRTSTKEFTPDFYLVVLALDTQPLEIWTMVGTAFLILILLAFIVRLFSKKVAQKDAESLQTIVAGINTVIAGDNNYRFPMLEDREFNRISLSLNTMLDENERLSKEKEELIVSKVESEMTALEAELNPHFLFNTLETIKYSIYIDKDMAVDLIYRLNKILRYSIDEKEKSVRLKTEVQYLKYYLDICQVRFGKRFSYLISLPEEAEDFFVPKLCLQPLVENSIKHNFILKDHLSVSLKVTIIPGGFQIVISDDGDGISPEKLEEIKSNIKSQTRNGHLGIFSSYNLLRLYFHDKVLFDISSKVGEGTTVTIKIKEGKQDVQSSDC